MRARYQELMANPAEVERILLAGARKARTETTPYTRELRAAVGLRSLASIHDAVAEGKAKSTGSADATVIPPPPVFKQYREKDGQFYFKLADPKGRVLLQSTGYASPRDAGQAIARLQAEGPTALTGLVGQLAPLPDISPADVEQALRALADAASN